MSADCIRLSRENTRHENTSSEFELFLMYGEGLLTIKAKTPTSHSFLKIQPFAVTSGGEYGHAI